MTEEDKKYLADNMPRDSYLDYLVWLCLTFYDDLPSVKDIISHRYYLSLDEWNDFSLSLNLAVRAVETLVEPLR